MFKVGSIRTFMISDVNGTYSEKSGTLQPIRYASPSWRGLAAWAVLSEVTVQLSIDPANLPLRPAPAGRTEAVSNRKTITGAAALGWL